MRKPLTKQYLMSRVAIIEETGCWEWTGFLHKTGYGELRRDQKRILAHRLAYLLWNGEWPNVCRHKCDNRKCCNPDHLENGTHLENARDRVERGRSRHPSGVEHCRAVLTWEIVDQCFALRAEGWSQQRIADHVGIYQTTVSRVLAGETWIQRDS